MTAAASTPADAPGPGLRHRFKGVAPWLLLAPGLLWLFFFYVLPSIQMFTYSMSTGSIEEGFTLSLTADNYIEALTKFGKQFLNSIIYGGIATILTFVIGFPVAYTIAFRGGRYRSLILFLVIAPFFTSFLLRTISWKIILSDNGIVLGPIKDIGLVPDDFRLLATPIAVIAGITYNLLPFMTLPLYVALEKVDYRLIEAANDLYALESLPFQREPTLYLRGSGCELRVSLNSW
jgi:spermidine/putrescine transport system permease protein